MVPGPGGSQVLRWWDGTQWTPHTRPAGEPQPGTAPQQAAAPTEPGPGLQQAVTHAKPRRSSNKRNALIGLGVLVAGLVALIIVADITGSNGSGTSPTAASSAVAAVQCGSECGSQRRGQRVSPGLVRAGLVRPMHHELVYRDRDGPVAHRRHRPGRRARPSQRTSDHRGGHPAAGQATRADASIPPQERTTGQPVTQITVNLDPKVHSILNRWIASNAPMIGAPYVEMAEVIAAMIVTTAPLCRCHRYGVQPIRHQRAAGQERGRG